MVACFRNVQLILCVVWTALILVQAFTTRNFNERFVCSHLYHGVIGVSRLASVRILDEASELDFSRNSFWLLGLKDDFYTIQQIKQTACDESEIPIIVFFMRPSHGLVLGEQARHYMPDHSIDTWDEYDELIYNYSKQLKDVPSLIVMEPSLLMHTFNSESEYHNTDYQLAFAQRVQDVVNMFPSSWVYVDAGNAMYLQWEVNLDHIISVLKKMPPAIRGFSINVGSFVNTTFNENLAEEIHCQTGLHYIIDTSRNGGAFSSRTLDEINECTYDPPQVASGTRPTFKEGASTKVLAAQGAAKQLDKEDEEYTEPTLRRRKRWKLGSGSTYDNTNDVPIAGKAITDDEYDYGYDDYLEEEECVTQEGTGLDAYAWVKTPGESDGRLFAAGTYHPCLLNNFNECSNQCPQYVPKISGKFQRLKQCNCSA